MNKIRIYDKLDFQGMRKAGKLASKVLDEIEKIISPGLKTIEIDDLCNSIIKENKATSACLNYAPIGHIPFPKSLCVSINNEVCHGIPSNDRVLKEGDIVGVDTTVIVDGYHGDTCRTFCVGKSFDEKKKETLIAQELVIHTKNAMLEGIKAVKNNAFFKDIGCAIEEYIKSNTNFSIVKTFCGHGIGKKFHDHPNILHYKNSDNKKMSTGMFFTVEPMINQGTFEVSVSNFDKWTVRTKDGSLSAQFEHTIAVTESGYEIFTE